MFHELLGSKMSCILPLITDSNLSADSMSAPTKTSLFYNQKYLPGIDQKLTISLRVYFI